MADFLMALSKTLLHEGHYADDPQDPGGETFRGISRRSHPDWPGWAAIDRAKTQPGFPASLTQDGALERDVAVFYKRKFWDVVQGDGISDQAVAEEMFDSAVNAGTARAVLWLQESLNALNRDQRLYRDLLEDGAFGPRTLAAVETVLAVATDRPILLVMLNVCQGRHYLAIMRTRPILEKYARGWFRRVAAGGAWA